MARKKAAPPPEPAHACGHALWMHSKKVNSDPWRCREPDCSCTTPTLTQ